SHFYYTGKSAFLSRGEAVTLARWVVTLKTAPAGRPIGAPRGRFSLSFRIKKARGIKAARPVILICSDDISFVARRLVELLLLLLIAGLAEESKRRLLARFDAGLVEGVDVEHRARVSGLQFEEEQELAEGE